MKTFRLTLLAYFCCLTAFALPEFTKSYPDTINKKRLWTTIGVKTGAYLGGLGFLSFIWYKDKKRVPFHFYNDAKGYLQMDKAGHSFAAYRESYAAYYALRWAGVSKEKALLYGGPIGFIFQTPIEVFDGMYEGWGFSWPDMAANALGSVIFTLQEAIFDEQIVLMKFSYSPSNYADYHSTLGDTHLERFFMDYNAHTYWFSGNLSRLTRNSRLPPWLNIAVGYSANGMIKEFENPQFYRGKPFPEFARYRQFLFSLDIDFSKIKTNKKGVRKLLRAVNLLKLPFPALEINPIDGTKWRWLYF